MESTTFDVHYPTVGITNISSSMKDILDLQLNNNSNKVRITIASQPNSYPHLGTLVSLMSAFSVAKFCRETYLLPTKVTFFSLENAPAQTIEKEGVLIQDPLYNVKVEEVPRHEYFLRCYRELFTWLESVSNISWKIVPYEAYQARYYFREGLLQMINQKERFLPILNPRDEYFRVRFPCPSCGAVEKQAKTLKIISSSYEHADLSMNCPIHGEHYLKITPHNSSYVDTNSAIRSPLEGYMLSLEDQQNNTSTVMVDGGDWGGTWSLRVFALGMEELGLKPSQYPAKLYTPTVTDWSGAKFSKSLYLRPNAYTYLPASFTNYQEFMKEHGKKGLERLWDEIASWPNDPKKFFRNYSVEYFKRLLS